MGIQVSVNLEDLPKEWKTQTEVTNGRCLCGPCHFDEGWCDQGPYEQVRELAVKFPKSGWIRSYVEDQLVFDNKNVNHQYREELEENNVPFRRG